MSKVVEFPGRAGSSGAKPKGRRGKSVDPDDLDLRLSLKPQTDLGNAERFDDRHRDHFRWCRAIGWLSWDGARWQIEGAETKAMLAIYETVRAIQVEAAALQGSEHDIVVMEATPSKPEVWLSQRVSQWGRASESKNHIDAMVKLASHKLAVAVEELDADPMLLTVANGTLVFRRPHDVPEGEDLIVLRPHSPADMITKLAPVIYDPNATAPVFAAFFGRVQPEDANRRYLAQWAGYSMLGDANEHKLAFFYGKGRNGKSTFTDILAYCLGDYCDSVPIETFLDQGAKRKGGDATPELAGLKGVRMLLASEPEKGAKLAEAKIKLITGGEKIKVRHLNRDFFDLRPSFKVTIGGNYRPDVTGSDEGIWARIDLVPWPVHIPKDERDRHLAAKLQREASGVLNFMLDGLRDYMENGLTVAAAIEAATKAYREDSDPLGRFLETCVREKIGSRVQSSQLHGLFCAWARASGENEWSNKGFTKAMKERGYRAKQSNNVYWLDCVAIKSVSDFLDAEGNVRREPEEPDDRPFADREDETGS